MKLREKTSIVIAAFLVLELIFMMLLNYLVFQSDRELAAEDRAKRIVFHCQAVTLDISACREALKKYAWLGKGYLLQDFQDKQKSAQKHLLSLEDELSEDSFQNIRIKKIRSLTESVMEKMTHSIEHLRSKEALKVASVLQEMNDLIEPELLQIGKYIDEIYSSQESVFGDSSLERRQARIVYLQLLNLAIAIGSVGGAVVVAVFIRGLVSRLSVVMENTRRLKEGEALAGPLEGDDELCELDREFADMASALSDASRKQKALVENARDVICSLDHELHFISVNRASAEVFGREPEALLSQPAYILIAEEERQNFIDAFMEAINERGQVALEVSILNNKRRTSYAVWSATWSDSEQSLFCVVHDITERILEEEMIRERVEQVRALLEKMPVALLIVDDYESAEFVNNTFLKLTGYEREQVIDRGVIEFLPREILSKVQNFNSIETAFICPAGKEAPVDLSAARLKIGDKERLVYAAVDIKERVEIQKMRQAFLSMISHDLRSPMSSVAAFLDLLSMGVYGEVNEKIAQGVSRSQKSIERLLNLINDLLDLQKLEVGAFNFDIAPCDARSIVETSIDSLRELASTRGITIKASVDDISINADEKRVVQVLVNLISNAIKFSPDGGLIKVEAIQEGNNALFSVSDQGRGVPSDMLESIFEPFVQVQSKDGARGSGTGLGLPVSKQLICGQGGQIGVDSEVSKGSRFYFYLPVALSTGSSK